ncbi:MAG TPA: alpha/beta hydrolase, partial [Methanocella sp.]|nr:alpha/beta hydrolase [Methanocella sp.]
EGEPLALIPGLASNVADNQPIVRLLTKKCRVLALDNRGAGRTDKPDILYTIEMMADDAAALMDAVGIKRANVMGISMGGRIAMALALQHPEKVKSLVLVSTSARAVWRPGRVRMLNVANRIPGLGSLLNKYPQPQYAFERQLRASHSYDCSGRLGEIRVPTLVLHGADDRTAPLRLAEEMHAGIRGSQMITFPGGHIFFLMKQEKFCAAVVDFLSGIDRQGPAPGNF